MSYFTHEHFNCKMKVQKNTIDAIIFIQTNLINKRSVERDGRVLPSTHQKINKFGGCTIFGSRSHSFPSRRNDGQDPYRQHKATGRRKPN